MNEAPTLHRYSASDRAEIFDFFREVFPPAVCMRAITQWVWRYEANPFTPPAGSVIDLIRIGPKLVSLVAGFSIPTWMGGIASLAAVPREAKTLCRASFQRPSVARGALERRHRASRLFR